MPYKRIQGNIQTQVTRSQQVLHFFNLLIYHASHMLELILAGLLTVALLISMLRLFPELLHLVFGKDLSQSFTEFLEVLFTIVVGVEYGAKNYQEVSINDRFALVFGNEGQGICLDTLKLSDKLIKIDMKNIDSLNVAVASGIIMNHYRGN